MSALSPARSCELHVHIGGCLGPEELLALGREHYPHIDWSPFCDGYERAYGQRPDPAAIFAAARARGAAALRPYCVYGEEDGGDFERFQAKFNFGLCVLRHWWYALGRGDEVLARILARHKDEGLRYVEYRAMAPYGPEGAEAFTAFHLAIARAIQAACEDGFAARYLISLPRWAPLAAYGLVRRLLAAHPELLPTIVGLDFCHFEEGYPPAGTRAFFRRLRRDNEEEPAARLEVAYHVGEVFFDKSLESAIRWCHQAAELGARRLGHCIALGLDPAVAVARRRAAHERESARERLAQIRYDLDHAEALRHYGIAIDAEALESERRSLAPRRPDEIVRRAYDEARLEEVRQRQRFVLDCLAERGVVIETCPTSNLRIGAVPDAGCHPVHRFLHSGVRLAVGADDPGVFDCTLAGEVAWVAAHVDLAPEALAHRLGDPRQYRFDRG